MPSELVYTLDEAAKALGIGRNHMRELVNSGRIPAVKLGKGRKIPKAVLDEWLRDESNAELVLARTR